MLQRWEYVCVSVVRSYGMNYRRNGVKVGEWKDRPIFDMLGRMGEEGFELTAYDGINYIFKRPKGTPVGTNAQPAEAVPQQPPQMQPIPRQNPQQGQQPQRPPQQGQPGQRPPQQGQPGQAPRPLQRPPQQGQPGGVRPLSPGQPPAPPKPRADPDDLRGMMNDDDE